MNIIADLLSRADRYRSLASRVHDEQTRRGLLDLAAKFEALAREMQADRRHLGRWGIGLSGSNQF